MREATGNAYIFYFIIIFTAIFIAFLVGSISYSKAFRVKNIIIDTIETDGGWRTDTADRINPLLGQVGYRIATPDCDSDDVTIEPGSEVREIQNNSGYDFCVYEISTEPGSRNYRGNYYKVVAYIYFDIPIIGNMLQFPVSGETKNIYDAPTPTQ